MSGRHHRLHLPATGEVLDAPADTSLLQTMLRDYPALADARAFADWREPGTVRVAFAHWAEPAEDGGAQLVSEARVDPVDTTARLRLKAIWAVLGALLAGVSHELNNPLAVAALELDNLQEAGGADSRTEDLETLRQAIERHGPDRIIGFSPIPAMSRPG